MEPSTYGPFPYVPITQRPRLMWPDGARVALWIAPNIEFFGLDSNVPGKDNERLPDARSWRPAAGARRGGALRSDPGGRCFG